MEPEFHCAGVESANDLGCICLYQKRRPFSLMSKTFPDQKEKNTIKTIFILTVFVCPRQNLVRVFVNKVFRNNSIFVNVKN